MTPELRQRVAMEARSWVGTPFSPHIAEKYVGADCVQLALAIYKECEIVPRRTFFPPYRLDAGDNGDSSQVLKWLMTSGLLKKVESMQAGTVVVLKVGRVEHHVGVAVSERQFVQSIRRYGVILSELQDSTWIERIKSYWEPV